MKEELWHNSDHFATSTFSFSKAFSFSSSSVFCNVNKIQTKSWNWQTLDHHNRPLLIFQSNHGSVLVLSLLNRVSKQYEDHTQTENYVTTSYKIPFRWFRSSLREHFKITLTADPSSSLSFSLRNWFSSSKSSTPCRDRVSREYCHFKYT